MLINGGIGDIRLIVESSANTGGSRASQSETFHPYVGWVRNPEIVRVTPSYGIPLKVNRWGFIDVTDGIFQRRPDRLIVGVSGGSVALGMTCAAEQELREGLGKVPAFQDREVILVRLCQSGYKQPQALFSLNYYTLLGAEFDLVINLDGYNELALPTAENHVANVALDYPQGWHARTLDLVDPRDDDLALRVFELRGSQQRQVRAASRSWLRGLPSYNVIFYVRHQRMVEQLMLIEEELMRRGKERKRAFVNSGPHPQATTDEEALSESIRIWSQASRQMHHFCEANNTLYVHAIQPNQYDTGSKPLSAIEREKCYAEEIDYAKYVRRGYPRLRDEAQQLRQAGVRMVDLTRLFEATPETLYVDPFCHVNQRGSQLMAEAIVAAIREEMDRKPPSGQKP